jgi:hypothetical protein
MAMSSFYTRQNDRHLSRAAIKPCLWGGQLWDSLHYMTLGYPVDSPTPEIRASAMNLMASLQWLLPCILCREHLAEIYRTVMPLTPSVFDGRRQWGEYVVRLRDYIKQAHVDGSSAVRHTFERDVESRLLHQATCQTQSSTTLLSGLALAVVIFFIYRTCRT